MCFKLLDFNKNETLWLDLPILHQNMTQNKNLPNCFFPCAGVCWASDLTFLLQPSDVIAVRDRPLMLDCAVQGEEPVSIVWHRNGVPIPNSQRIQILKNGTLLIQRFQKRRDGGYTDAGDYDCAVQNRYGLLVSRKAKVRLACKSLATLQMGEKYMFFCKHFLNITTKNTIYFPHNSIQI